MQPSMLKYYLHDKITFNSSLGANAVFTIQRQKPILPRGKDLNFPLTKTILK